MQMLPFEDWPMAIQLDFREGKPVPCGSPGSEKVRICGICLGHGTVLAQDGGRRECFCTQVIRRMGDR